MCRQQKVIEGAPRRQHFLVDQLAEIEQHLVGEPQWHQFPPPGGVTGLYLLSESHLACHTYPEYGVATFNLYCCRMRPAWDWEVRLAELLGAQGVTVRRMIRGTTSGHLLMPRAGESDIGGVAVSGIPVSVPRRAR